MYPVILILFAFLGGILMSLFGAFSYWLIPAFFALRYLHIRSVPSALYPPTYLGLAIGMIIFSHIPVIIPVLLWSTATLLPPLVQQMFRFANTLVQNIVAISILYLIFAVLSGGLPSEKSAIIGYVVSILGLASLTYLPFFDRERGGFRVAL